MKRDAAPKKEPKPFLFASDEEPALPDVHVATEGEEPELEEGV